MTTGKGPNLQVPQAPKPESRSSLSGMMFVLLLVLLVVNILRFFVSPGESGTIRVGPTHAELTVEQLREAAVELEKKNVSLEAARLWESYLAEGSLPAVEAGNVRFRIGKNYQNAGAWGEAFAQYVLAEKLLGDENPDLTHEIGTRRIECLRRMGQFADLSREIAERATGETDSTDLQKQQVVAEVDGDKITVTDFDRLLSNQIELAIRSRMGLSPDEEDMMRRRAFEQTADPKVRAQVLDTIVQSRVLSAEARKRKVNESEAFRDRLTSEADRILAETFVYDEINKRATVTDADVERYYEANRDRYDELPATFIAHILARDEAQARDLITRIESGESFENLAKTESLDTTTNQTMGIVDSPVSADGAFVPMFGANAALHDAIRDAAAGSILPDPYESSRGWHVIKIVSHRERVERPFEEVADAVRRDTFAARRREVTEQLIAELYDTYHVKLYPEAFAIGGTKSDASGDDSDETPKEQ